LKDYPYTELREELAFLILHAKYEMARNSVLDKQAERYRDTVDEYYAFLNEFPDSKHLKEAEKFFENAQKALKSLPEEE
jgi:outer membrane protein assembly factor BamD